MGKGSSCFQLGLVFICKFHNKNTPEMFPELFDMIRIDYNIAPLPCDCKGASVGINSFKQILVFTRFCPENGVN